MTSDELSGILVLKLPFENRPEQFEFKPLPLPSYIFMANPLLHRILQAWFRIFARQIKYFQTVSNEPLDSISLNLHRL
jgi:hypothetical protein